MKFSPNGYFCAVGSNDYYVDVYSLNRDTGKILRRVAVCKGHTSPVTAIDWCAQSRFLRSNSKSFELLFWDAADGDSVAPEVLKNTAWSTVNCNLSWGTAGVWPSTTDGSDICSTDLSSTGDVLVASDDFGGLILHPYPCHTASTDGIR